MYIARSNKILIRRVKRRHWCAKKKMWDPLEAFFFSLNTRRESNLCKMIYFPFIDIYRSLPYIIFLFSLQYLLILCLTEICVNIYEVFWTLDKHNTRKRIKYAFENLRRAIKRERLCLPRAKDFLLNLDKLWGTKKFISKPIKN